MSQDLQPIDFWQLQVKQDESGIVFGTAGISTSPENELQCVSFTLCDLYSVGEFAPPHDLEHLVGVFGVDLNQKNLCRTLNHGAVPIYVAGCAVIDHRRSTNAPCMALAQQLPI